MGCVFLPCRGRRGRDSAAVSRSQRHMQAPNAMETMARIQNQHRLFAGAGLGVALAMD